MEHGEYYRRKSEVKKTPILSWGMLRAQIKEHYDDFAKLEKDLFAPKEENLLLIRTIQGIAAVSGLVGVLYRIPPLINVVTGLLVASCELRVATK